MTEELGRVGGAITTHSGALFFPLDPRLEEIEIADIAHALSQLCRFGGHTHELYSVAQHSLHVCEMLKDKPLGIQLWGLMHDAAEAYLVDLPSPIKHTEGFKPYRVAEEKLMKVIAERFGLVWPEPEAVREADRILLYAEGRQLFNVAPEWALRDKRYREDIFVWAPEVAKNRFLARFESLMHAMGRDEVVTRG